MGAYELFEWTDLDKLLRSGSALQTRPTLLVTIGDEDFADPQLFGGMRPLRTETVVRLVAAACAFEPAVVGVDLLTDHWTAADRQALGVAVDSDCTVVWARDGDAAMDANGSRYYRLRTVVDGVGPNERLCMGLPVYQPDRDGVVRNYQTVVSAVPPGAPSKAPEPYATLIHAVTEEGRACDFHAAPGATPVPQKIRYSFGRSFARVPARTLLDAAGATDGALWHSLKTNVVGAHPIVLIGATFRDAKDVYMTPIGPLSGIDIVAHGSATIASGRPIHIVGPFHSLLIDAIVGSGIVVIVAASRLRLVWGTLLSLTLSFAGAFAICFFLFDYFGRFLSVFASISGAVLGSVVDMMWGPMWRNVQAFIAEYHRLSKR